MYIRALKSTYYVYLCMSFINLGSMYYSGSREVLRLVTKVRSF